MKYDPLLEPDPAEWTSLDEQERMILVEDYHRRNRIKLPNARVHAVIHAVVENQIAMGDEYEAKAVLERLMREGLDRHEAIHAIGSVVSGHIFRALKGSGRQQDLGAEYLDELRKLTAKAWRNMKTE